MTDSGPAAGFPQPRLSSETLHATCVATEGRAVLIMGPSGSGKSDLALRLLDRGYALVSDDQTIVRRERDRLLALPPGSIAGKMEVRGLGIVGLPHVADIPVALIIELTSDIQRLPDRAKTRAILGLELPVIGLDALPASAPSKVALALEHFGLKP